MKTGIPLIIMCSFFIFASCETRDTIKIMPVGNSITAGEHYKFPALEERTGYRKPLYTMLIKAGYKIDLVGSQKHGKKSKRDKDWFDWNCEAYPGWRIPEITNKVDKALRKYNPDILLIHVGTNGKIWDEKPAQVEKMLDMINDYSLKHNHSVTVFLCLIIKRFIEEDSTPTTTFNTEITKMVNARATDKIKIILVDMENGAGLDYSDNLPDMHANPPYEGGDMLGKRYPGVPYDKYHPNDKGNTKMAIKFYEELVKVLPSPAMPASSLSGSFAGINSSQEELPLEQIPSTRKESPSELAQDGIALSKKIVLAGGCFWGMEELIRKQEGVLNTTVGYTGGKLDNPNYKNHEGHAEAVEIEYDPKRTSYKKLLDFFFQIHNPTTLNRQGNDIGSSYRSAIFYGNEEEKKEAELFIEIVNASKRWKDPVVTMLEPLRTFYKAEEYHQDYLRKNPGGYTCHTIYFDSYLK